MPFGQANFAPVGANSTDSPAVFSYTTSDTLLEVISGGYFSSKKQLRQKDVIFTVTADGFAILQIGPDTSTAIPEFISGDSSSGFLGIFNDPTALEAAYPAATTQKGSTASVLSTETLWFVNDTPLWEDSLVGYLGDMLKSMYDPTLVEGDAFSMGNMVETALAKVFTDAERIKLAGIETGAEVNPTAAEIKTEYESNPDTNAFTDAQQNKLASIETGAQVNPDAAEVKVLYESNANTNAFTDAEQTKLAGIETGAEVNPTASEIKTEYESNADTNAFTDAEKTKLSGIEAGAEVNDDTLQDVYNRGQSVSTSSGPISLDNTGETTAPFEITPNSTPPTTGLSGGQIFMDSDGSPYSYDATRSKFLSLMPQQFTFAENGGADNEYLRVGFMSDADAGYIMPFDGTIVAITADSSGGTNNKGFDVEVNGVDVINFNLSSGQYFDTTENTNFAAGDRLQVFCVDAGGNVQDPVVSLFIKWRK